MRKILSKAKAMTFLVIILIIIGIFFGYKIFGNHNSLFTTSNNIITRSLSKPIPLEVIVKKVTQTKEINVLETELTENFVLDDSWWNLDIFKKTQVINFNGTGIYSVDLEKISKDDIKVDQESKTITVNIDKPYIKLVTINEDKTEYRDISTGLFRYGEINIPPSEYLKMCEVVKGRMKEKLESAEMYDQAVNSSNKTIEDLISTILVNAGDDGFKVQISYK